MSEIVKSTTNMQPQANDTAVVSAAVQLLQPAYQLLNELANPHAQMGHTHTRWCTCIDANTVTRAGSMLKHDNIYRLLMFMAYVQYKLRYCSTSCLRRQFNIFPANRHSL